MKMSPGDIPGMSHGAPRGANTSPGASPQIPASAHAAVTSWGGSAPPRPRPCHHGKGPAAAPGCSLGGSCRSRDRLAFPGSLALFPAQRELPGSGDSSGAEGSGLAATWEEDGVCHSTGLGWEHRWKEGRARGIQPHQDHPCSSLIPLNPKTPRKPLCGVCPPVFPQLPDLERRV